MSLTEAIRRAAERGCELVPISGQRRYLIRAIGYDADPYEIDEELLMSLPAEQFVEEWLPPHA